MADDGKSEPSSEEESPILRIISVILTQAVKDRATRIYITPGREGIRVCYRIDGAVSHILTTQKYIHAALASRLKIMAGCNEKKRCQKQNGQIVFSHNGRTYHLKTTFTPFKFGEKIVIKIPK